MGSPESELNMDKKESNTQGFTLIELLITVVIISLLAGIVTFNVASTTQRSQTKACNIDYQSISSANASYFNDSNVNAASLQVLVDAGYLANVQNEIAVPTSALTNGNGVALQALSRKGSPYQLYLGYPTADGSITVVKNGVQQSGKGCS